MGERVVSIKCIKIMSYSSIASALDLNIMKVAESFVPGDSPAGLPGTGS